MILLTVAGSAEDRSDFEEILSKHLADGFNIRSVIPLDEDEKGKRFIAFVQPEDESIMVGDERVLAMLEFLSDIEYNGVAHETEEDATVFATEEYGDQAFSAFTHPITSQEIRQRDIFIALISTGQTVSWRGLLDGQPVLVICHMAHGELPNDYVAHPLVIFVDDDLGSRLELPIKTTYDK